MTGVAVGLIGIGVLFAAAVKALRALGLLGD